MKPYVYLAKSVILSKTVIITEMCLNPYLIEGPKTVIITEMCLNWHQTLQYTGD